MRAILVRPHLIVNPKDSFSGTVDVFGYYFLVYSNISINVGSYPIDRVLYTYIMTTKVLSLFTLYKRQGWFFHLLNPSLRVIVLMFSLDQLCAACLIPQTHLISPNISSWIFYFKWFLHYIWNIQVYLLL